MRSTITILWPSAVLSANIEIDFPQTSGDSVVDDISGDFVVDDITGDQVIGD